MTAATVSRQGFKPALFDPGRPDRHDRVTVTGDGGRAYVFSPEIVLAVNAALATERALLVAGDPGTGKSTLAASVAQVLERKYYEEVVSSRTRARDLMWRFDAVGRLADSQPGAGLPPRWRYVEPQVLWWAFDALSAAQRGHGRALPEGQAAVDPNRTAAGSRGAVVLIDEIDKAEPDVPNDLLEALELERFRVEDLEGHRTIAGDKRRVLMVFTTNRERELPAAFVRRCVVLDLDRPEPEWEDWLVAIANQRFGAKGERLHRGVAQRVMRLREAAIASGQRKPSTAEYLDTLRACRRLGIGPRSPAWALVESELLSKAAAGIGGAGRA